MEFCQAEDTNILVYVEIGNRKHFENHLKKDFTHLIVVIKDHQA